MYPARATARHLPCTWLTACASWPKHHPDDQIAERLNGEGFPTATGLPWTLARVRAVRRKHQISTACPYTTPNGGPRGDGLVKVSEAAQTLGVNRSLITDWFHQGYIQGVQRGARSALWVRLGEGDLHQAVSARPAVGGSIGTGGGDVLLAADGPDAFECPRQAGGGGTALGVEVCGNLVIGRVPGSWRTRSATGWREGCRVGGVGFPAWW